MTLQEARMIALMIDDTLRGEPEENRRIITRLRRDFPEFAWNCIQHCPPIFMVSEREGSGH